MMKFEPFQTFFSLLIVNFRTKKSNFYSNTPVILSMIIWWSIPIN